MNELIIEKAKIIGSGLIYGTVTCLFYLHDFILSSDHFLFWWDLEWWYSKKIYPLFLWNENVQMFNVPNHILFRSIFFQFQPVTAEKVMFLTIFSVFGALGMYGIYYFLKKNFSKNKRGIDINCFISSSLAIVFLMFNFVIFRRIMHYLFLWYLAFSPILFFVTYKTFSKIQNINNRLIVRASILIAFILFLMSFSVRIPYFGLVFIIGVVSGLNSLSKKSIKKSLILVSLISLFYTLFSSIWLFPILNLVKMSPPQYILRDQLSLLSQHSNLIDVLTFNSFWSPNLWAHPPTGYLSGVWWLCLVLIPILAFSSCFLLRKKKVVLIFAIFSLFLIFLAKGINAPYGEIYRYLIFSFLPENIAWQFRAPNKWNILLIFALSFMLSITIKSILDKLSKDNLRYIKPLIVCVIAFAILFPTASSIHDMKKGSITSQSIKYEVSQVPSNYKSSYKNFETDENFMVLFSLAVHLGEFRNHQLECLGLDLNRLLFSSNISS